MGQQCSQSLPAETYQLGKKTPGIKIKGNSESIYTPMKNSAYRFQKSETRNKMNPVVQRIRSSLGYFTHSKKFNPPKGVVETQSYVLNEEGLTYCQNGQWKNGMPHGKGQLIFPDGSYYVGYLQDGVPHGQGRFISSQGWYYEGQLKNQQADGKGKFINDKIGIQYEGQWAADLPNGNGIQTWRNKNLIIMYEGQFVNGVKHGIGKYSTPDFTYQGRFENNQINGKGRIVYKNGEMFQGNFVNGKKHGYGLYRWTDNSEFQGVYQNDIKHGIGKFTNPNGKVFEGKWVYGKRQGQGIVIYKNKEHIYQWKNNQASPQKRKY